MEMHSKPISGSFFLNFNYLVGPDSGLPSSLFYWFGAFRERKLITRNLVYPASGLGSETARPDSDELACLHLLWKHKVLCLLKYGVI